MHAAEALRYFNVAPGFALIGGDFDGADIVVADPLFARLRAAVEDRQQPVAVVQNGHRLANKGTRFIEQGSNVAPALAQIR